MNKQRLRREALDLRDMEAREEWVKALEREGLIDEELKKALFFYFFAQDYLDGEGKSMGEFARRIMGHLEDMQDCLVPVVEDTVWIAENILQAIEFLGLQEEFGVRPYE